MLPLNLSEPLRRHLSRVKAQHEQDLEDGFGSVHLPFAFARKSPNAAREWAWQYVFPSSRLSIDPRSGRKQRHHIAEGVLQSALKRAVDAAGIVKRANCHSLSHSVRHTFTFERVTTFELCRSCSVTRTFQHNHDLYARAEPARNRCEESAGLGTEENVERSRSKSESFRRAGSRTPNGENLAECRLLGIEARHCAGANQSTPVRGRGVCTRGPRSAFPDATGQENNFGRTLATKSTRP